MQIHITKTKLISILPLRKCFLQEFDFQIRNNVCHAGNWSDSYLIMVDGKEIGYGSVKGKKELNKRDTIFEYYLTPNYRNRASLIFSELLQITKVKYIESQSNDLFLSAMLYEFAENIKSHEILFEDGYASKLIQSEIIFRKKKPEDVSWKNGEVGEYVLDKKGEIVAEGGFLFNFNLPFVDLYMEVKNEYRRLGLGSFIIQKMKKECYKIGHIPGARCYTSNVASKATLQKGGFKVCGYMLLGVVGLNTY